MIGDSLAEFRSGGEKTDISGLYSKVGRLRPVAIEEFVYSSVFTGGLSVGLALRLLCLAASLRWRDLMEEIDERACMAG